MSIRFLSRIRRLVQEIVPSQTVRSSNNCAARRSRGPDVRYRMSKTDVERISTIRCDYNSTVIQCLCRSSRRVRPAFEAASSACLNSVEVILRFITLFERALPQGWYWSIMLM